MQGKKYQNTVKLRLIAAALLTWFLVQCGQNPRTGSQPAQDGIRTRDASDPVDRHADHLIFTRHARCRMDCRHITEKEIREVLEEGTINYNKSEPDSHPDPKYAMEGYTKEGQHLRIVFAVPVRKGGESSLVVVTCIELGVEWQCDCH
jgi:hypothetical protein